MNNRLLIFLFLVLISENVFSQSDTVEFTPVFYNVELDEDRYQELLDLEIESKFIDKQLREAKNRISLLEKNTTIKDDSLRDCLNPTSISTGDTELLLNPGKYYALIIAVSDYKNDKIFPDLPEAANDGKELKEVLEENYFFERVELLLNPTKKAIGMKFDGLIHGDVTNNDNVLIFYAGHGYMWKNKKRKGGYWCPADAELHVNSTLLNDYEILNQLQMIEAKNVLLISDACHASSITRTRSVNAPQSLITQVMHDKRSAFYISSGSDSEVSDDSKFFKHLALALKENTERNLSATDLFYKYLEPNKTSTLLNGQIVIPQMSQLDGHELGGDFFFIKKDK